MTAKDELLQYKYMVMKADFLYKRREIILTRATKITASISETGIRSNGVNDKIGNAVAQLDELKRAYLKMYLDAELKCAELLKKVGQLEEPYASILRERYLNIGEDNKLKPFEEVSVTVGYSYSQTTSLHGEALRIYEEKYLT